MIDSDIFWNSSDFDTTDVKVTNEVVGKAEESLGYKLPKSYINLLKSKNGGTPKKRCYSVKTGDDYHVEINSIYGVGGSKGIDSKMGSKYLIKEWDYPDKGIVIGSGISGGIVIMLDYSKGGISVEPEVIYVDVDSKTKSVLLASSFEEFIDGLVSCDKYSTSEEDFLKALETVEKGSFSKNLNLLLEKQKQVDNLGEKIRVISREIVVTKRDFLLHGDDLSILMYDIQFWLLYNYDTIPTIEDFYKVYPTLIALSGGFTTGGFANGFLERWYRKHIEDELIVSSTKGLVFNQAFENELINRLKMI